LFVLANPTGFHKDSAGLKQAAEEWQPVRQNRDSGRQVQSDARGAGAQGAGRRNGAETPVALNDYIEIGVFSGKKEKFAEEHKTFEICRGSGADTGRD
jgi:hypothetical protein